VKNEEMIEVAGQLADSLQILQNGAWTNLETCLLGWKLYWKDLHAAGGEKLVQHLGVKKATH